jgi:hypothetical protein
MGIEGCGGQEEEWREKEKKRKEEQETGEKRRRGRIGRNRVVLGKRQWCGGIWGRKR